MDLTRVTVFCFTASYVVAFVAEALGLVGRQRAWLTGGRRLVTLGFAVAGVFAHAVYLALRAREQATPLSSPQDWYLLAALVLAAVYLATVLRTRRWSLGVFALPSVLVLIAVSRTASGEPFSPDRASLFWGQAHGWTLLGATVSLTLGFLAALMRIIQDRRLKAKLPPTAGFSLPSLEWLDGAGGRANTVSTWLVGGGFLSGLVLTTLKRDAGDGYSVWTDPVVLALGLMLAWLIAAAVWRNRQPSARRGATSAWLAVASFVLMAVTLATVTLVGAVHGPAAPADPASGGTGSAATAASADRGA
ncbi:MAG: hypothetical protein AAFV43_04685 [Planctomycetota bacterium]